MAAVKPAPFPVVGVGASAGGLEAFMKMAAQFSADFGGAIVFVPHLSAAHKSDLVQIISRISKLPVSEVVAGASPQRGHLYVIPSSEDVTLIGGLFVLQSRSGGLPPHMPIDTFLTSLADQKKSQAIGVILSGTGADGTLGLCALRNEGGITIVQSEDTAKFSEMPLSAGLAVGGADFVLPPEKIVEQLERLCGDPVFLHAVTKPDGVFDFKESSLSELFKLLRKETGADFSNYKGGTIGRRITRRMILLRARSLEEYVDLVKSNPKEARLLFNDLLINVTSFFRDPDVFDGLRTTIFPALMKNYSAGNPIRIWVPGCATGEEAFSIAMSFMDFLQANKFPLDFQIFATDISSPSITKARTGFYRDDCLATVSEEYRQKFFTKVDGGYQIEKSVRDRIIFAAQNVIKDPPFSNLDLISCRNLLIYFSSTLQSRVLAMFHYSLRPAGYLLLGSSESAVERSDLFTCIDTKQKIFTRSASPTHQYADMLIEQYYSNGTSFGQQQNGQGGKLNNEESAIRQTDKMLLDQFAPVGFLINENLRIVQFRGDTSPFLSPTPGSSSLNVMDIVRTELRFDIRRYVSEAKESGRAISKNIEVEMGAHKQQYILKVMPIVGPSVEGEYFLIVFSKPGSALEKLNSQAEKKSSGWWANLWKRPSEALFEKALKDLEKSKEQVRAAIEERDAMNEELRSSNEEILSANEELQSTNEELETAKEELQSSNEELHTVNDEIIARNQELRVALDDLANLLASSQIPIVMVGCDLKIRIFTPAAEKFLNFSPSDMGRHISDVNLGLDTVDLAELGKSVIDNAQVIERQVFLRQGGKFSLRVHPYKTSEKKLDGVIYSFISID